MCYHPGRIILKSRGLHVVVIGSSVVVAVASRPAARNRNRQLGQPMSNVRHIRRRTFAVFSTLYPTFMPSSLLISVSLSRFFLGRLGDSNRQLPSARNIATLPPPPPHVPNTAIYVRRSDFPLYRITSYHDCSNLHTELFELFDIQSIAVLRGFTCFRRSNHYCRTFRQSTCQSWNAIDSRCILLEFCQWLISLFPPRNFISTTSSISGNFLES